MADRSVRTILTNMCMITDGSKVLVEEKILADGQTGIIFPGGHVEAHESVTDSVIREIREETGLTVFRLKFCGIKDWMEEDGSRYIVFLYRADSFYGELRSSEEGRVFWVERKALDTLPLIWNLKETMAVFETDRYSEVFYPEDSEDEIPVLL